MTSQTAEHQQLRREQRFSLNPRAKLPVNVAPKSGEPEETGAAIDISFSGAKIKLKKALAPKCEVALTFGDNPETRAAEVCWSRPAPGGAWWVGVRFEDKLTMETIDELAAKGIIDRRQDDRRLMSVEGTARYQLDGEAKAVRLVNMSSGGFSLETSDSPGDSQRLMLTVPGREGRKPITVPARIAWFQETEAGCQLGCQFTQRDSSQKLHAALLAPRKSALARWRPNQDAKRTAFLVAILVMTWSLWLIAGK